MGDEQKVEYLLTAKADAAGTTEMAKGMEGVGKAGAEANQVIQKETEKTVSSKSKLKAAVKGLKEQFPELAHFAKLALNPITIMVVAATSAWALYKKRVEDATRAQAGFELPNSSSFDPGHISAVAKAWDGFADALNHAATAAASISTQSDHALANIRQQTEETKKLLDANKNLDLAKLEQRKGSMTEDQYVQSRLSIEDQYSKAGIAEDMKGTNRTLAEKYRRAFNLGFDSRDKGRAGDAIKVASQEDDDRQMERLKIHADIAQKDIEERTEMVGRIHDAQSGEMTGFAKRAKFLWDAFYRYGGNSNARSALETEFKGIARSRAITERYNKRMAAKRGRDILRKRQAGLYGERESEGAESISLDMSLPGEEAAAAQAAGNASAVAGIDSRARLYNADAEAHTKLNATQKQIDDAIAAGRGIEPSVINALGTLTTLVKSLDAKIKQVERDAKASAAAISANPTPR